MEDDIPEIETEYSPLLKNLCKQMCAKDHDLRPTIDEVLTILSSL